MIPMTAEEVTERLIIERNITPRYIEQVKMKVKMDKAREIEARQEKHDPYDL